MRTSERDEIFERVAPLLTEKLDRIDKLEKALREHIKSLEYYRDSRYNVEREDFDHMIGRIRAVLTDGAESKS